MIPAFPIAILAASLAFVPAANVSERLPRALAALSPAHFADQVRITDDGTRAAVVFSTRAGYTRSRAVQGAHVDDVHLRALVDRASGQVTWQIWHDLVTVRRHKQVVAVQYMSGGMLRTARPIAVQHSLGQCPPTDGAGFCNRITRIGFELPERAVREMAASYDAKSRVPWRLHFQEATGQEITSGIAPAEAAGLITAIEAWRRDRAG